MAKTEVAEQKSDPFIKAALFICAGILIGVLAFFSLRYNLILVFIGALIPIITFMLVFLIMSVQKKRIQKRLNESFGGNVVKIASAIMDYFEMPLNLVLSIALTLFLFAICLLAALLALQLSLF